LLGYFLAAVLVIAIDCVLRFFPCFIRDGFRLVIQVLVVILECVDDDLKFEDVIYNPSTLIVVLGGLWVTIFFGCSGILEPRFRVVPFPPRGCILFLVEGIRFSAFNLVNVLKLRKF